MPNAEPGEVVASGLRTVSASPLAQETPLASMDAWITPTDRFYVRNHFADIPRLDTASAGIEIGGAVDHPFSLTYDELVDLQATELAVTLECAGNSRGYMTPPAEGIQFDHGAVGNARWKGVPLADVLTRAHPNASAREVLFVGADGGEEEEEGKTLQVKYERSLPLDYALDPNILLAYEMNGKPLEPAHGYPIRLIVPGWYGMASVKWLTSIRVLDTPFKGFFQERRYVFISEGEAREVPSAPLSRLQVKSLIASPRHGEVIHSGEYTVCGFAWSGEGTIDRVEVSIDGGRLWRDADLLANAVSTAWRQWELPCTIGRPGHYIVMARASDSAGNTQATTVDWNFRGYANNGVHTIAVEVPPTAPTR